MIHSCNKKKIFFSSRAALPTCPLPMASVIVRGCYRFDTNIFFRHLETFIMNTTSLNSTSCFEENSTSMVIPDANLSAVSFLNQSLCLGKNSFQLGYIFIANKILEFGIQSSRANFKILAASNCKVHIPPPFEREFSPKCKF